MLRTGFCVSGTGHLFRAAVMNQARLGITPALLLTHEKGASDLEAYCRGQGVPQLRLASADRPAFDARVTEACVAARLDLLVLTFDKVLPASLLERLPGKIINVHMGLLPAFKGLNGVRSALRAGVKVAGASIHEVTDEVDGGPLVAQCAVAVAPTDDEERLGQRIFERLRPLYLQTLAWYAQGRVVRDDAGRLWVKDGDYSAPSTCPGVELADLGP